MEFEVEQWERLAALLARMTARIALKLDDLKNSPRSDL